MTEKMENPDQFEYSHEDSGLSFCYNVIYEPIIEENKEPFVHYMFQAQLIHPSFPKTVINTIADAQIYYGKQKPRDLKAMPHQAFDKIKFYKKAWGNVDGEPFQMEDVQTKTNISLIRMFMANDILELIFFKPVDKIDIVFIKTTEKYIKKLYKHLAFELPEDKLDMAVFRPSENLKPNKVALDKKVFCPQENNSPSVEADWEGNTYDNITENSNSLLERAQKRMP